MLILLLSPGAPQPTAMETDELTEHPCSGLHPSLLDRRSAFLRIVPAVSSTPLQEQPSRDASLFTPA